MTASERTELDWVRFRLDHLCAARNLCALTAEDRVDFEALTRRERELLARA